MKIYLSVAFLIALWPLSLRAQKAPEGFNELPFRETKGVQLTAFVEKKPGLIGQRVWWSAKNFTNDRLEIKFIKVINTTCGTSIREEADTYLKPGGLVVGSTFSGEITFETQVRKEDCANTQNRVKSVNFEKLVVTNLDEQERKEEEKRLAQEKARNAATTSSTSKPAATTSNSANNSSTSGNYSNKNTSNQNSSYQAEQQRIAKQREEENRQRQIAMQQAQQKYDQQMKELTAQSMRRAQNSEAVMNVIGTVFQGIRGNQIKKYIDQENTRRRDAFSNMKEKLKEGNYELEDCIECDGQGEKRCRKCNGEGKKKCTSCLGQAGSTCSICHGTGQVGYGNFKLACSSCFGKGTKQCLLCNNTGMDICSTCNGTGNDFCNSCTGTGKKLNYVPTATFNSTNISRSSAADVSNNQTEVQPFATLFPSSSASEVKKYSLEETIQQGKTFLEKNKKKPGVITTKSGLQYIVLKQGTGRKPSVGDTILYLARWYDLNGKQVFNNTISYGGIEEVLQTKDFGFFAANLEAFPLMPVGSRYRFFIPHYLAMKDHEWENFPAGSTLVVEYELLQVKRPIESILKEETSLDTLLINPFKKELVPSLSAIKTDSAYAISYNRSFHPDLRDTIHIHQYIVYREGDGYYPLEVVEGSTYEFDEDGSGVFIGYFPTLESYKRMISLLYSNAKKLKLKIDRDPEVIKLNNRPLKKLTGDEFWENL